MELNYFILKRVALDKKTWFCVCYHGVDGKLHTESKHQLKRDADYRIKQFSRK